MQVKVKKLHKGAILPVYATAGAACFDLHALENGEVGACSRGVARTGLSFEVPAGHVMLVYSRSGHGFKHGVRLANSVGVIDSDYRGEVSIGLRNDSPLRFDYKAGDRLAQAMILPVPMVELVEAEELSDTERGAGGFGSTGK
ncbi:dUTP diphosphatase [Ferrovum sp.]|uniref:dUTP diphosphatase n=1 Tax=Ferrovum sp. TaxID=2609467 RepID=UPI00261EAB62|nr:dUTP diphosphatase [Ferrovum sp.]